MKNSYHWKQHFLFGVLSSLNIIRTFIFLKVILWITNIKLDCTNFQALLGLFLIDMAMSHNLYDGWEFLQFYSFMRREMQITTLWRALKLWVKEQGYNTFGDYVADHLGHLCGITAMCILITIVSLFIN